MTIYITHCSAKKDDSLKSSGKAVGPDVLYTAGPTLRFMSRCKAVRVPWAIFSDLYGVWFPDVQHQWYEKNPDHVTELEFRDLVRDFDSKLGNYEKIVFYRNPGRFHRLYRRLVGEASLRDRIQLISHLSEIG